MGDGESEGIYKELVGKQRAWLRAYLDETNPKTFLNNTGSAEAAGYKAEKRESLSTAGSQNYRKLQDRIELWLDEVGFSDAALKRKTLQLMSAKETKFFQHEGFVVDQKEVEALGIQTKALDMANKVKGLYAPEKHALTDVKGADLKWVTEYVNPGDPIPEESIPEEDRGEDA